MPAEDQHRVEVGRAAMRLDNLCEGAGNYNEHGFRTHGGACRVSSGAMATAFSRPFMP